MTASNGSRENDEDPDDMRDALADRLEELLHQSDPGLMVLDFDRGDDLLIIAGRQLDDYDWERYDQCRAVISRRTDGSCAITADGHEYESLRELADHWLALIHEAG